MDHKVLWKRGSAESRARLWISWKLSVPLPATVLMWMMPCLIGLLYAVALGKVAELHETFFCAQQVLEHTVHWHMPHVSLGNEIFTYLDFADEQYSLNCWTKVNLHFWRTVCKMVHPMLSDHCPVCPVCLSVCNVGVFSGQTVGWIKMPLDMWHPGHIVLDGDPAPLPHRRTAAPQFLAHVCCGQTAGWIKMPLGMEVGLGPGHIVLDGDPAPPQKGHSPQFSTQVYCGQTVAHLSYC